MSRPVIELIPAVSALPSGVPVSLDVLIRITPPVSQITLKRPALNLGLVLDRSGSMEAGNKLGYAKEAALFAVAQLTATDRISVTTFDDAVAVPVPATRAESKERILDAIRRISTGGSTALHDGWLEGVRQVGKEFVPSGVNRVLLLSDGLANHGETDPAKIAEHVTNSAKEGVSTTTIGVGLDYNEKLLQAMARAGDGNYYHLESPKQLTDIFQTELQELQGNVGANVRLNLQTPTNVNVEVLNELEAHPDGGWRLANLVSGLPIWTVVRLRVPVDPANPLLRVELAWDAPNSAERQTESVTLTVPTLSKADWDALPRNVETQERAGLLEIARLKKEATLTSERGDRAGTLRLLEGSAQVLSAMPITPETMREKEALDEIIVHFEEGREESFRKSASYQSHRRHASKPYLPPEE